jgi:hypothetical protein
MKDANTGHLENIDAYHWFEKMVVENKNEPRSYRVRDSCTKAQKNNKTQ